MLAPPDVEAYLVAQFNSFCSIAGAARQSGVTAQCELSGAQFNKLFRDCKVRGNDTTLHQFAPHCTTLHQLHHFAPLWTTFLKPLRAHSSPSTNELATALPRADTTDDR
jgi:hypothetical protein